jgi:two-component system sensor histidine kinase KdpD
MAAKRPAPESFLQEARHEEERGARGKLKIFLGAAPGVGKTYAMLEAARLRRSEGLEAVVGVAETHGRRETEALLEGLEVLPRKIVDYRGIKLQEFDIDAALARHPALMLVDELAHTNAPGCRHAKRWQDAIELLDRGIDVYATLNIQHLDSLNDVVAQITGVTIRETVPDSVLERADVELIDLPPEELLARLKQGKVYFPEQAARAAENYFKPSNLAALRELSLRATAEGVGAVVEDYRRRQAPRATWPTSDRLMVCVGPGPYSAKLVRSTKRMAVRLKAEWTAVFVESERGPLSPAARTSAIDNLRLAERLGAETLVISARDVVEGALDLARQRNVTQIVVGKHIRPRLIELLRGSIVDDLIRKSGDIDVYVITSEAEEVRAAAPRRPQPRGEDYAFAALVVALCTAACFAIFPYLARTNLVMVYLLGTLVVAMRGRRGPALFASLAGVLCFDYFFVPPRFSFGVSDTQYIITFLIMAAVAVTISRLAVRLQSRIEASRLNEMRTAAMHALSRRLVAARGTEEILAAAVEHVARVFEAGIVALAPDPSGALEPKAWSGPRRDLDAKEKSVAQWVYDLGQSAGLGTQTLPVVDALYAPLVGAEGPVGVLRVEPRVRERLLVPDQMLLLESFAHHIALALEVDRLQESARQSHMRAETERLRSSLLSAVSHDLRTPLAAILGSAESLSRRQGSSLDEGGRELLRNIQEESQRLSKLVQNLIETTRLESGAVRLTKEPHSLEEVLGASLEHVGPILAGHDVKTDIPADLPLVPLDAILLEQVFVNLLDNAARHTPAGTPIELSARVAADALRVEVADRGPGLAIEDLERVFEKFYRAKSATAGAGLGLAICKAVVEAHGGRIWAENRAGGGAIFIFTIPLR